MSIVSVSMKLKVVGFGVAAALGGIALLGTAAPAAASYVCSLEAPTAGNGTCWNELDSNSDSSGDFRNDAGWTTRFQTNGGGSDGDWSDLTFLTTGLVASQFSTQKAFGAQDPDKIEATLEGSDWFGQDLTFVSNGDISGKDWTSTIGGNVVYIHTGGFSLAFLFDDIPSVDFFIDGVGKGLSNYRIYTTEISAVPLPAALPLFGAALIGIGYLGRRRKKKALAV